MTQLDGQKIGQTLLAEVAESVALYRTQGHRLPGLAVVLVGHNPASLAYVGRKKKACETIGFYSRDIRLPESCGQKELLQTIDELNQDPLIDGILVQLPLPGGQDYQEQAVIEAIDPAKDVDGFHPINMGNTVLGLPSLRPCTPYGICQLLKAYQVVTEGKHVVVLGRSNIVGKPIASLLSQPPYNATVTLCHSKTSNLIDLTRQADILVVAIGQAGYVTEDMIKEGAVVVDVGINRVEDANEQRGYRLVGDVDEGAMRRKASFWTPVPGGVGPMTIAVLMQNTLQAYQQRQRV